MYKVPAQLKSPKKRIINIKNNDQKCFLLCHVRHLNPVKIHPERITQNDKELVNDLDYDKLNFLCEKKILARLKQKTTLALICLVTKIDWFFQSIFQINNVKTRWICCM